MEIIIKYIGIIIKLFTYETWIYILSISLQVAGAICLLINYWGNVKKKVILTYYAGGEIPKAQDNNMVRLKRERLQSCAKDIYMNRFAFICIAIGYGLGLYGEITEYTNKLNALLAIILFCILIISIGCGICVLVSKKVYKEDMEVDRNIIEKFADVQWSDKEEREFIDSLFKDDNV